MLLRLRTPSVACVAARSLAGASVLLVAVTASALADEVRPPFGPPATGLLTSGRVVGGADGPIFFAPSSAGGLTLVVNAPTAPFQGPDLGPGTFTVTAPAATGWHIDTGSTAGDSLLVDARWDAGAAPASITVTWSAPNGQTSPPAIRRLLPAPVPSLASIQAVATGPSKHGRRSYVVRWTESSGPDVVMRELDTQLGLPSPQGCGDWRTALHRRLAPAVTSAERRTLLQDYTAAVARTAISPGRPAPVRPDTLGPLVNPVRPSGAAATAVDRDGRTTRAGSVSVGPLSIGYCYRFVLTEVDALGGRTAITSATIITGARDAAGDILTAWRGGIDLYRPGSFASQRTWTWCVAAATQMMRNLVTGGSDASYAGQRAIITYAHHYDDAKSRTVSQASNPEGWEAALDAYAGPYRLVKARSLGDALAAAALRIRMTGRPVGLVVMAGEHAWVMTGMTATSDPATGPDFRVTGAFVSGPLYPHMNAEGYDPAPDTYLTTGELSQYFEPVSWAGGAYELLVPAD